MLIGLAAGWLLVHRGATQNYATNAEDDIVLRPPKEQKEETEGGTTLPEGRKLFVDPEGRFSFQYEARVDANKYQVEGLPPNYYAICDALNCLGAGVEISELNVDLDGRVTYDYKRLTYDRSNPDSYEAIEWNGLPAYRAIFRHAEYPERLLFLHIPYKDQMFTLYRSTLDHAPTYRQFEVMSSTFRLFP